MTNEVNSLHVPATPAAWNEVNLSGEKVPLRKGPGERLRFARENANLSIDDIAKQLYLTNTVVLALEADEKMIPKPQVLFLSAVICAPMHAS